jgi:hypothetical protein
VSLFRHEEELEALRLRIRELEFTIEKNPAKLNIMHETLEIAGVSYSLRLFDCLGSFLPIGAVFELVDRAGGAITLRHLVTEIDIRRAVKTLEDREAQRAANFAALDSGLLE